MTVKWGMVAIVVALFSLASAILITLADEEDSEYDDYGEDS
jgi:hypothetical protein